METIIITKKVKSKHGGHHGGAWKVAFADFVTAMMALFIVLWVLGQSQQVKQSVAQHFRNPGVFETTTGTILPETTGFVPSASEQEKIDIADAVASLPGAQQWQPQELLLGHLEKRLQLARRWNPDTAFMHELDLAFDHLAMLRRVLHGPVLEIEVLGLNRLLIE